ncbi:hypothetical protein [Alkaliphilus sp. B6464]|uniref:hypothetical protein n=1 Tax=Alkaliphilus sp. B6464 TaxID=2731219 RepID=UPI001BA5F849|nr:hypothetical protein [Alkaliphilus sp. B6464]QUH22214.1 hypothetical protein HYG84_20110 [Alkaliphilus sp. B6464]
MKITLISQEFKTDLKEKVLEVLNGHADVLEVDSLHPSVVINFLEELGVEIDLGDDMDTNGWQWDYWIKFKYNDKKYCLSGSGYYGNLKIKEDTDEDVEDDLDKVNKDEEKRLEQLNKSARDLLNDIDKVLESN